MLCGAGCRLPAPHDLAVTPAEVIVGRALTRAGIVMLTDRNVLVRIDREGRVFRTRLEKPPAKLWGLGSQGGELFTVAGFIDLVRVSTSGTLEKTARYPNPIANLVDTETAFAAQLAVDVPGSPLLMTTDAAARLSALPGVDRHALGLPRAEEGVLHLLACSVPPRAVCWLPGSDEVLALEAGRLRPVARLEHVERIAPAAVLSQPTRRAIHDALELADGNFLVLARAAGSSRPRLVVHDPLGRALRVIPTHRPLRILLDESEHGVRAIDAGGRLIEVRL